MSERGAAPVQRPRACRTFLRQAAAADLIDGSEAGSPSAARHLAACAACENEIRGQRAAIAALRAAAAAVASDAHERGADSLSSGRVRLVLQSSEQRPGLGWGLAPLLDWRPAMAVGAAAAIALTIGLGARVLTPYAPPAARDAQVPAADGRTDLQVVADGSAVTLSWNGDGRSEHRVIRATDPRNLAEGRVAVVRGSQWVDPDTNGSRVVFYVVD